jgi:hypothetical protein
MCHSHWRNGAFVRTVRKTKYHVSKEDDIEDAVAGIRTSERQVPDDALREAARRAVRRFFGRELGRKPLCYAVVARTAET